MKKRVYVETSIPSFYYTNRTEQEVKVFKNWTQQWWDTKLKNYDVVTSSITIAELAKGSYPTKQKVLKLIEKIPILPFEKKILDIVETYIANKLMPKNPPGDALHLAYASYYKCDFLLTWNYHNLVNANKFEHIRVINTRLKLFIPDIVTPIELLALGES